MGVFVHSSWPWAVVTMCLLVENAFADPAPTTAAGEQESAEVTVKTDKELLRAVLDAVEKNTPAAKIEEVVEQRATVNTIRAKDKDVMGFVDLAPQPPTADRNAMRWIDADYLAYWIRPVELPNPQVVGVAWHEGKSELFFAEILPP